MYVFEKVRRLLGLTDCEPIPLNSRKRRDSRDLDDYYQFNKYTKYRRVCSEFPKYIPTPLEDYPINNRMITNPKIVPNLFSQRSSKNSPQSSKYMRGHTNVKKKISNYENNYAVNDESDDDIEFNENIDLGKKVKSFGHNNNYRLLSQAFRPKMEKKTSSQMPTLVPINKINTDFFRPTSSSSFREKKTSIMEENYDMQDKMSYYSLLQNLVPSIYEDKNLTNDKHIPNTSRIQSTLDQHHQRNNNSEKSNRFNVESKIRTVDYIDLSSDEDKKALRHDSEKTTQKKIVKNKDFGCIDLTDLPQVAPVNSLKDKLDSVLPFKNDIVHSLYERYNKNSIKRKEQILKENELLHQSKKDTCRQELFIKKKLMDSMLTRETIILDEDDDNAYEIDEYPELTDTQLKTITSALYGGAKSDVVASNFNINIKREDLLTLKDENWLNDAIINYYMNLLMERGKYENSPKVYAMNTFFIPKLLQSGHAGLRRWTRKVDIFSFDIIPVPVHVGEVHWCMAIIHLKNKTIQYYDSMGRPNNRVLEALEKYIKEESLDKKNENFDTSDWRKESMLNCPKQENGSDCGVFSCMFAEFITRNSPISFGQQHMQYFRQKMMFEIVNGKLILEN